MLVSDVLDRTYSEWLYPAGVGRPNFDTLLSELSSGGLSISLSGRVSNLPADTILEIESELILTASVVGSTVTVSARGYLETDAVAHAAGTRVYVDPKYPRKVLFNALNTLIGDLWGLGVYLPATDSSQTYTTQGLLTLPSGARRVVSVLVSRFSSYTHYRRLVKGRHYEVYPEFSPVQVQLLGGGATDRPLVIRYAKEVSQASLESDNLTTLGVPTNLQPHLTLGLAGYLLQSRELPRVQVEEIRRLLSAAGVQVGAALNIGQALYNQYLRYVLAEAAVLRQSEEGTIEIVQ